MVCLDATSFGKYYCYSQCKRIKTLKEKTAVDLSELPSEVRLLRLLCLTPERGGGWGGNGHANGLWRHHHNPNSSSSLFPLENLQRFSLLSDHDKHSSDCSDFWGLQGSRVRGQQVNTLPTGASLGSLLSDPYDAYLHFLPMNWMMKGVCWETRFFFFFFQMCWEEDRRGGGQHVYL